MPNVAVRQFDQLITETVLKELLRRALPDDVSLVHDGDLVAQDLRFVHVVGREDNRRAVGPDVLHESPEIAACLRVEPGCRLIKKDQLRVVHECHGQQQALPLPTGQFPVIPIQQIAQRALLDNVVQVSPTVVQRAEHLQGLADRNVVLKRRILELNAGFLPESGSCGLAVVEDLARGGLCHTLDNLYSRGLAGTIGPQQPEADSFLNSKADAVYGQDAGVLLYQVACFESRCHGGNSGARAAALQPYRYERYLNGMKRLLGIKTMVKTDYKSVFTVALLCMLMATPAFAGSINKSIKIAAGETSSGESSVNGSITVGADAEVTGGINTVNGSIRVDSGATIESASTVNGSLKIADNVVADDLSTVNGGIRVGESTKVDGGIEAVNGRIGLANGAVVARGVENVNGEIELSGAEVGGDISTIAGNIEVVDGSVVKGDIIVEKPSSWGWGNKGKKRKPKIVIGPGSSVEGVIRLEREVELYISETANVGGVEGVMSMDDAVRFSGDRP